MPSNAGSLATVSDSRQHDAETELINSIYYPVKIHTIPGKGVGLTAKTHIPKGSSIIKNIGKNVKYPSKIDIRVSQYFFVDPETYRANADEMNYVILCGEMLFLNHSDTPNADVVWEKRDDGISVAYLVARRNISENEEISIKYTDIEDYQNELLI